MAEERAVYIISVAAELAGVHPQTLRVYERKGLIEPYRTPGGTRRYSQVDLNRLALIADLTAQGVNLEGVRQILQLRDENARLTSQVNRLRRLLEEAQRRVSGEPPSRSSTVSGSGSKRNLPDIQRDSPFAR